MDEPIDDSLPIPSPQRTVEQPVYYQPVYYDNPIQKKVDVFAELDKSTIIIIIAVFIIGFFMGKSMTPVILKSL